MIGTVKSFNAKKGYGFILYEDKEYFVHFSQIRMDGYRKLSEGQEVEFELGSGPNGEQACKVVPLD